MKTNEVEKILNISAKAIRFYEENQLLAVARDNRGYRNYSEENIQRLKEIKLYREMGISISDIKGAFDGEKEITDSIYKKIDAIHHLEKRKSIYVKYIKDLKKGKEDVDGCLEALSFLHTKEYQELKYRTLGGQIAHTILLLLPILYILFFFEEISVLYYIVSLGITILLTLSWTHFIKEYEFTKDNLIRDIKTSIKKIVLFILFVTIGVSLFMFFQLAQKIIFVPDDFILLEFKYPYMYIPFFLFIEAFIILGAMFNYKREMIDIRWTNSVFLVMKKYSKLAIFINVLLLYISLTSICVITDKKIVDYTFYNPLGVEYTFNEVKTVETGFRGNQFGVSRNKGDFYYRITFSNGVSLSIENPYANEKRYQDTYEEYIELDTLIMKHDVIKIASDKNIEYTSLDSKYINIMLTVINNK